MNIELQNPLEITNFINRIIHAYDSVDDSIVWAIKPNYLPIFKSKIKKHTKCQYYTL